MKGNWQLQAAGFSALGLHFFILPTLIELMIGPGTGCCRDFLKKLVRPGVLYKKCKSNGRSQPGIYHRLEILCGRCYVNPEEARGWELRVCKQGTVCIMHK